MADRENNGSASSGGNVNTNGKRPANEGSSTSQAQDDLPQPYNAQQLQPAKRRAVSPSEQPRKQKRPGTRSRITESEREAIRQRQIEREQQWWRAQRAAEEQASARHGINVVREHYNSVPERGREWRTRESRIKGLRVFNNWVKSCIIQRYSPDEDHAPGSRELGRSSGRDLLVLDIGCGKGGDLNKWQAAPQPIELYVGLDPADVSIQQARDRYRNLSSRGGRGGRGGGRGGGGSGRGRLFDGRFYVKDCYSESIEDLDIIRQVGFDPSPMNHRGFDVVSMMFSMHYAFESEENARTMLRNVAGALKKGGRFIGCIPNSDVLGEHVRKFNEKKKNSRKERGASAEKSAATAAAGESGGDGEKEDGQGEEEEEGEEKEEGEAESGAEWGNSIYRVRFPGKTPEDGVFRPAFGWKYNFFLDEAVEEVPEYVVPWEAFRALADDFNLELQFHRTFPEIWEAERDDRELGPLSERMGVRGRDGKLLVSDEEMEAASFYIGFCFYKV
ncbi:mRNA (guanine-N7-)-methyltransferase [Geosmithia morbida]|uniref:mRNA cap guanine-N(7) methyltransferase n=1 Tax=Geosmithia morbida TaxID=1094350 RepID=A0A9P4Z1P3_9HYPO|nr:mRNA (guanine-N7-)-methyltransferase [Geosmithia morbida]KAF4125653.1 mRNA (guanine-N7-)-methyltransferase [Geosmithia morbida]